MKIADIELGEKPLLLAPMEDVTDPSFRYMCKRFGADVVYTEFISSDGLIRDAAKSLKKLEIDDAERPVGIQLYGHLVEPMVEAARMAEAAGPDIIDINFGCPVKKIAGRGAGSGMMRDVPLMVEMTRRIVEAVGKPVTVKTRLGWDDESKNIEEIALRLQDVGIAALTIHGRTRAQMYRGEADWTLIGKVKNNPRIHIPIIGNGDVDSGPKAAEMFDRYGVDGVMIGRATYGRPWIFREVKHYLATGEVLPQPSVCERVEIAKEHLRKSLEIKGEYVGILEMRRHLSNYFKGLPDFKPTRLKLVTLLDIPELFATLDSIAERWGDFDGAAQCPNRCRTTCNFTGSHEGLIPVGGRDGDGTGFCPLCAKQQKIRLIPCGIRRLYAQIQRLLQHTLDIGFVILHDGLVLLVLEERRRDQEIGRRTVDRRRDIVERRQAQQRLDVDVVRLRRHGIPEEDQGVDLAVGDQRPQLLVTAQRAGFEQRDFQVGQFPDPIRGFVFLAVIPQCLFDHLAGRTRTNEMMAAQVPAVPVDPFGQVAFHIVVGNQCQHFCHFSHSDIFIR